MSDTNKLRVRVLFPMTIILILLCWLMAGCNTCMGIGRDVGGALKGMNNAFNETYGRPEQTDEYGLR